MIYPTQLAYKYKNNFFTYAQQQIKGILILHNKFQNSENAHMKLQVKALEREKTYIAHQRKPNDEKL
jgi:hypothetical protein